MSYLAGPLSKAQIRRLSLHHSENSRGVSSPTDAQPHADQTLHTTKTAPARPAPNVAEGITTYYLAPSATWAKEVGANPAGTQLEAAIAARCNLRFDERRAGINHREQWEAILFPLTDPQEFDDAILVNSDERDFVDEPPTGVPFSTPSVSLENKKTFQQLRTQLKKWLLRNETLELFRNPDLKLYARVDETKQQFSARCIALAEDQADREVASMRDKAREETQTVAVQTRIR